jgi:transketolase
MSLNKRSKDLRKQAIKLSKANGGYHFGGSFSCAEILIDLYDSILKSDDLFILSKGHGCWVYYCLLIEKGFSPKLEGHPHYDPKNGIYCTTGSMGHGFPTAIGLALSKKLKRESGKIYVLLGDGECQEGTTWESLLIAGKLQLDNLVVIIDNNKIQGSGNTAEILDAVPTLMIAAQSSNWTVSEIDGHNESIIETLGSETGKPLLINANTIKGYGVSFMENTVKWHSNWLNDEMETRAMGELS